MITIRKVVENDLRSIKRQKTNYRLLQGPYFNQELQIYKSGIYKIL